jgi:exodeoxyribonuclease X
MTLFRVIDFETTGFPPDAGIVEIGWCDVKMVGNPLAKDDSVYSMEVGSWQSELTDPGRPIEIAAMAIHHIQDEDVAGRRKPNVVLEELIPGVDFFVAHNAKFEKEFFEPTTQDGPVPWICTLKAAYILCPKSPNHQNQTIRYYLKTPVNREDAVHTHRAGPDAYVTAHTLAKFLTAVSPSQLTKWETQPPHFPFCPIGQQWRGKPWADVDTSFLSWIMKTKTMEEDIKFNAKRELDRRFPDHKQRHEENNTGGFKTS